MEEQEFTFEDKYTGKPREIDMQKIYDYEHQMENTENDDDIRDDQILSDLEKHAKEGKRK